MVVDSIAPMVRAQESRRVTTLGGLAHPWEGARSNAVTVMTDDHSHKPMAMSSSFPVTRQPTLDKNEISI